MWSAGVMHIDEEAVICGTLEACRRVVVWMDIELSGVLSPSSVPVKQQV